MGREPFTGRHGGVAPNQRSCIYFALRVLFAASLASALLDQPTTHAGDPVITDLQVEPDPTGQTYRMSWWAEQGQTYFIQTSEDLLLWRYHTTIVTGSDRLEQYAFSTTAPNIFVRLKQTDQTAPDPYAADFDEDGASNQNEITRGTDPLEHDTDSDRDELPDDWERTHFGNLASTALADADSDGLTNLQEFRVGLYPTRWSSFGDGISDSARDSDGDGIPDWQEVLDGTVPNPPTTTVKPSYALIDFGSDYWIRKLSDNGRIWGSIPLFIGTDPRLSLVTQQLMEGLSLVPTPEYPEITGMNNNGDLMAASVVRMYGDNNWNPLSSSGDGHHLSNNYIAGYASFSSSGYWRWKPDAEGEIDSICNRPDAYEFIRVGIPSVTRWSIRNGSPGMAIAVAGDSTFDVQSTASCGAGQPYVLFGQVQIGHTALGIDDHGNAVLLRHRDGSIHYKEKPLENFMPLYGAVSANGVIPGIGTQRGIPKIAFWKNGRWTPLSSEPEQPLAINNRDEILTLGESINSSLNLYVPSPESEALYEKILVEDLLPPDWRIDRTAVQYHYRSGHAPHLTDGGILHLYAKKNSASAETEASTVLLIPAALTADINRDGKLTSNTPSNLGTPDLIDQATKESPFRFWINDDDDQGSANGDDIPGRALNKADYNNAVVDSVRDLVDFFPVYLDLKQLLAVIPPSSSVKYKLKHEDGALNFVYTNLTKEYRAVKKRSKAFDYQYEILSSGFGPAFTQGAGESTTQQITAAGVDLTEFGTAFLDGIKNNDWGVILVEGRTATDKPLVLSVEKADGTVITEVKLHLKISPVEQMYRHVNLTAVAKNYDGTSPSLPETPTPFPAPANEPANFPNTLTNGKYFVFLHGYNVDAQKARGWNAEVFKRMHTLGSKARFVGITWHGATGLDYHRAVFHAFQTGDALTNELSFTGSADVTIAAHSLGNMVVSNAIQKIGGLTPARYYMINAATPLEAYAPSDVGSTESANMTELAWRNYDSRLYMANWHTLFAGTSDNRKNLKWKELFKDVGPRAHNFYSEEENVVTDADGNTSASIMATLLNQGFDVTTGAWKAQELVKGVDWSTSAAAAFMIRGQAGWGFNLLNWYTESNPPGPGGTTIRHRLEPAQTVGISDEDLKTKPFFDRFIESALMSATVSTASDKAGEARVRYDLFARGIPAMSNAAAANFMTSIDPRNYPMHTDGKAASNGEFPTPNNKWRHSDFKVVALPYVYPMYEQMISRGSLK